MFEWRTMVAEHRRAARRVGALVLAGALGLLVVGGTIRVLRAADRNPAPTATSGAPSPTWTATIDTPVTGLAVDEGLLYVASDQLTIFPATCVVSAGACAPRWRGIVPDGPLSVPTVRDDRVFVGSASGQVYAFPATCDGEGCPPEWVGVAGTGRVSQPAANFDLVYVTSDELYAFPAGCADEDLACAPAWSADVPGRPAEGPPALGNGLVVVASSSTRGGVAAYPAVCGQGCEPVWTGRTDGPATSVSIGDGFAYTVARGQLMAFPLSCTGRCRAQWRGPFVQGAAFATGATSAPAFADGRVLVGDDKGGLWVFRSTCDDERCEPIEHHEVATTPLYTPAIDGVRAMVSSANGALARVLLECEDDTDCDVVRIRTLGSAVRAPAVVAPGATIAGSDDGRLEAFRWTVPT